MAERFVLDESFNATLGTVVEDLGVEGLLDDADGGIIRHILGSVFETD